jgi:hypothetical protein
MKSAIYSVIAALAAVVSLSAQETSHFAFAIGVGYTAPVGRTGMYTDLGFNTSAGFGYNFNSHIGALINLNVDSVGVNSTTLGHIGVPGGNINVFSATVDPIVHLMPHSRIDVYVTGGGGEYRREQIFVAPLFPGTFGGNDYFGFAPGKQIVYSSSVNKPGFDAGIGLAFGGRWPGKFYMEAKYNKIFLGGPFHMDYVPVTFGYRW